MKDQNLSKIVAKHPIGNGLKAFRESFSTVCDDFDSLDTTERPNQEELQNCTLILLSTLQIHPAARLLRSDSGRSLFSEISRLNTLITSDDYNFDLIRPFIKLCLANSPDDALIWDQLCGAVAETTPPPRPIPSSLQQTPWSQNTRSFVNSSEFRQDVDRILKQELGPLYVGIPKFCDTFFGVVPHLEVVSETVFRKCSEGDNPLFNEGWTEWPAKAKESDVLAWFCDLVPRLEAFARDLNLTPTYRRKLLAQPKTPLLGSTGKRSMDTGFVRHDFTTKPDSKEVRYRWSHILVPGELKSNPAADKASIAWIDLATYAREVLAAQETRRFVLGFTLCGHLMRIWEFDRLGGIASDQFDINKNGRQFVTIVLAFLCMGEDALGFDPTIAESGGQRYFEFKRNGQTERIILDEVIKPARCIAGRATVCWNAHHEDNPRMRLVIKDSWQYTDREEEGELLQEATEKGVVNVARYYYHETVRVCGSDDNVQTNVRKGLDIKSAANYRLPRSASSSKSVILRKGRSSSRRGVKRSSSEIGAPLPPRKRSCPASRTKMSVDDMPDRVHRRVIVRDCGKPIYKAKSCMSLLITLEGCIQGHLSLHKAGILHRDISINNLMMNDDDEQDSWRSFLIDLDLSVREQRKDVSGAKGKTGTRAFMAIGVLLGDQHSFMHDLESFFWVLFWICIYYNGPDDNGKPVERFENWNYMNTEELAQLKKGQVSHEQDFIKATKEYFTPFYQPLVPWVNRLRKAVFPNGRRWDKEDEQLYSRMKDILREAQADPQVQ
ncbi:serine/threonine-protein kinase Sgk2 [Metarhizium rileyi]|uniref:non-specific serine/threonine protein kinase n=1 Tax=Metarhizium rileyi (strain RCEF 4871) TaxID=1649241 RepID=A0A166WQ27_METRR|nr:serine/threonine-protein kinase Sgk2 [Metarhizium rileyi RCEF 4871]